MKLEKFIRKLGMSDQEFNEACTEFAKEAKCTPTALRRYMNKGGVNCRIPRPSIMRRIYKLTKGKVTPNDFYDL